MEEVYNIVLKELQENRRVLIHCHFGISRSAACILYCLMKLPSEFGGQMNLKDAFKYTKGIR